MASNPSYLRLADRIAVHGCQHDVESGFGISGFDVKQWPKDDPEAEAFCRAMLRQGIFEEASRSEHEAVLNSNPEMPELNAVMMVEGPHQLVQEHQLRRNIRTAGQKVQERRARAQEDLDDEEAEDETSDDRTGRAGDAQAPSAAQKRRAKKAKSSEPEDEPEATE